MKKVIFMGTPDFAVASLNEIANDENFEIPLVITRADKKRNRGKLLPTPVKERALELGLEVITPKSINTEEVITKIKDIKPDYIAVVAYGQIIGKELIDYMDGRMINVHSSILPKYRGAAPINWAIVEGEKESGVSIMLVGEGLDQGDILKIEKTPISEDEDAGSLHDRLMNMGAKALVEVLNDFDRYYENRTQQDENEASYYGMIKKEMGKINFTDTPEDIYNKMRGFKPWPGSYFIYKDKNVKVHNMHIINEYNDYKDGEVVKVENSGIKISCKDGYIVITELQFPNKKRMSVEDYLKGNDFEKGIILK